jgi:hypothetical protein
MTSCLPVVDAPLTFSASVAGLASGRRGCAALRSEADPPRAPPSQCVPRRRQEHLRALPRDPTYVEPAETKHDHGVKGNVQDKNAERKIGGVLLEFG